MMFLWPSRYPVRTLGGLALSILLGFAALKVWQLQATPSEAFYIRDYLKASLWVSLPRIHKTETPRTFTIVDGTRVREAKLESAPFYSWLRTEVYNGRTAFEVLRWPFVGFAACAIVLLALGSQADSRMRERLVNEGIQVSGRKLVTANRFNRKARRDPQAFLFRIENSEEPHA